MAEDLWKWMQLDPERIITYLYGKHTFNASHFFYLSLGLLERELSTDVRRIFITIYILSKLDTGDQQ